MIVGSVIEAEGRLGVRGQHGLDRSPLLEEMLPRLSSGPHGRDRPLSGHGPLPEEGGFCACATHLSRWLPDSSCARSCVCRVRGACQGRVVDTADRPQLSPLLVGP